MWNQMCSQNKCLSIHVMILLFFLFYIVEDFFDHCFLFFTPPRNRGGVIFSLQFVCVSVCPEFLWTKFQPNECTDLDTVFTKWLLITLARTLLNLVTLGQRSRSRWPKMYVKMMKKIRQKFRSRHFWNQISSFDWKFYCRHFDTKYDHVAQ